VTKTGLMSKGPMALGAAFLVESDEPPVVFDVERPLSPAVCDPSPEKPTPEPAPLSMNFCASLGMTGMPDGSTSQAESLAGQGFECDEVAAPPLPLARGTWPAPP